MQKKRQMRVKDPESASGWKTVPVKEDPVDNVVDGGFSVAFIVGAVIAIFVILGFPFYLMGKWIYSGFIALGFTKMTSLYASLIIGVVYLLLVLIFSIISRKSKDLIKRKKAKLFVRITAVFLPTLSLGAHLWRYFLTNAAEKDIPLQPLNIGFMIILPLLLGFVFWKITSRFLLLTISKK